MTLLAADHLKKNVHVTRPTQMHAHTLSVLHEIYLYTDQLQVLRLKPTPHTTHSELILPPHTQPSCGGLPLLSCR